MCHVHCQKCFETSLRTSALFTTLQRQKRMQSLRFWKPYKLQFPMLLVVTIIEVCTEKIYKQLYFQQAVQTIHFDNKHQYKYLLLRNTTRINHNQFPKCVGSHAKYDIRSEISDHGLHSVHFARNSSRI